MSSDMDVRKAIDKFKSIPERNIAELDTARTNGGLVAGIYCIYAPNELIRAAGAIPVGLCGKRKDPIQAAEKDLPVSLCPLIKSSYGYAVTDTCPFFRLSDVIVAESTCDGKKKMYELLSTLKPTHVMQLPHTQTGSAALRYWVDSLHRLEEFLCSHGAQPVREDELTRQIVIHNTMRSKLSSLMRLAAHKCSPLSGLDLLAIQESKSFTAEITTYVQRLEELERILKEYLEQLDLKTHPGPRLLLTGVPVGKGSEKVIRIAEELGARVVCMENCTGLKGLELFIDEEKEPYQALAERYLKIPCSCMSPNPVRRKSLFELGQEYGIHGAVDLTWLGCHTYNTESSMVKQWIEADLGVPVLHLETDYSDADVEQLRTRIEAFLELLEP